MKIIQCLRNTQLNIELDLKFKDKSIKMINFSLSCDIEGTDPLKDNLALLQARPLDPQN